MTINYARGLSAEKIAQEYLEKLGYRLLHHRYRSPYGEIDLIMQEGDTTVAVEVKYRKNIEDSHYSISDKQMQRISSALLHYLGDHEQNTPLLRCDVVLLSSQHQIIHYKNAW
jgi:putative endonuclease